MSDFNNTTQVDAVGPMERTLGQYLEMTYLAVMLLFGGPLNLTASTRLNEMRKQRIYTRLLYLKVHLNISDLMVILIYVTSRLCWLMTYDWRGGSVLCPTVHFAQFLAFSISSNIIVCIALDRVLTVFCLHYYTGTTSHRNLNILLFVAWALAIVCSVPQFWVWTIYSPLPQRPTYRQCVTIWAIRRHRDGRPLTYTYLTEKIYNGAHLIIIFWLPLLLVVVSYFLIFLWLCVHKSDNVDQRRESLPNTSGQYTLTYSNRPSVVRENLSPESAETTKRLIPISPSSLQISTFKQTRIKILKLTILLVGAYVLCWLPYNIMALWMYANPESYGQVNKAFYFLYSLVVLNSTINPFLYGAVACPSSSCVMKCLLPRRRLLVSKRLQQPLNISQKQTARTSLQTTRC